MRRLRVGFIGAGYISGVQMRVLQRLQRDVEIAAIAEPNEEALKRAQDEFRVPKIYSNWKDLVEDPSIDIIHNCTPNHIHYAINKAALLQGKHVFSEKPLAVNSGEGRELLAIAKERGLKTGINFCYRFYPVIREAAFRVRQGELGDLTTVTGSYFQDHLLSDTDYNWRLDPSMSGSSSMIADLGSHWFDLVQFLSGESIVALMAETHTVYPERMRDGEPVSCELEDIGALMVRLEGGAIGTFITSQMAAGRKCTIDVQLYGTRTGMAWNHERPGELWMGRRLEPNQTMIESPVLQSDESKRFALLPSGHPMGYQDAMFNLFREYYGAVLGLSEGSHPTFEDGVAQLDIVQAAVTSAKEKGWVQVKHESLVRQ